MAFFSSRKIAAGGTPIMKVSIRLPGRTCIQMLSPRVCVSALSPSLRVCSLEKATKDMTNYKRPVLWRLIGCRIVDWQNTGLPAELKVLRRSRHQRPRYGYMDRNVRITSNVPSFRSFGASRNIRVQPVGKVAHPDDMGLGSPWVANAQKLRFAMSRVRSPNE